MSRRGDGYEERDYYSREEVRGPQTRVRERDYEEIDTFSRRSERGGRPDFLREDFGRSEAGPLVIRERDTEVISRPIERRPRSPSPVRIRERIIERSPTPPQQERIRTRIVERERREPSPPPPERLRARVIETRERIRERSPSPVRIRERIVERERERERTPSPPQVDRVRIRNIEREVRQPTPEPSPSPSPPPPPAIRAPPIHQEIITHHRHIDHGFERARVPTPPPPPRRSEAKTKETDIDIYTSRNNTEVDITRKEVSRARTPGPTLTRRDTFYDDSIIYEQERDKLRVRDTRLDINRRRSMSARPERREKDTVRVDIRERDSGRGLGRDEEEAAYYERKASERAFIGEAYNGATKDWAIVDVPPGTERVRMDGVGGASQEITWQKYNGVRRSKFNPQRDREREVDRVEEKVEIRENTRPRESSTSLEIDISRGPRQERGPVYEREYERIEETSNRQVGFPRAPPKQRMGDLWTEITKDLVSREAIDELGYDYEETEFFFYVLQYLRYEDVLELVQLSETIRRERKQRLREIEYERERMERWEHKQRRRERERDDYTDERIIEREVVYNERPPRRGGW